MSYALSRECNGDFSSTRSESDCGERSSRCTSASASVREANGPANLLHVSGIRIVRHYDPAALQTETIARFGHLA